MSRQSDGTDKPVPAMKKPILLEDIEAAQQPHSGAGPEHATEPLGYPADPQFQLRGGFKNLMLDAATPLFGLVIRLRTLDDLPNIAY
ncbi:DotU family type IV/VI secretion system protein, partial [Pseudomonas monteilii]|nr:DotU family type IV/VI secretion system protein [Pseudomonas monteilii]